MLHVHHAAPRFVHWREIQFGSNRTIRNDLIFLLVSKDVVYQRIVVATVVVLVATTEKERSWSRLLSERAAIRYVTSRRHDSNYQP